MTPMPVGRAGEVLAAWLLTYWIHSTLLLAGAWAITRLARAPEVRDVVWRVALLGGLLTASVQTFGTAPPARVARPFVVLLPGGTTRAESDIFVRSDGVVRHQIRQRTGTPGPLWAAVALAWLAVAAGTVAVRAVRRRTALAALARTPAEGDLAAVARALDLLRRRAGLRRRVALTASERLASPAAIGWSEVCVPRRAFAALPPDQRDAVLAHELAHLARADALWQELAAWAVAVFPFQPLNRLARRELREAAELLCDDAAVRQTGGARPLAECLATLAAVLGGRHASAAAPGVALAEPASPLVTRVRRLLERGDEAASAGPRRWRSAAGVLAAGAIVLATAAFAPGVPAPRKPDVDLTRMISLSRAGVEPGPQLRSLIMLNVRATSGSTLRLEAQGALIDATAGRVVRLLPGGHVRVTELAGEKTRAVEISPSPDAAAGLPVYRYTVGGRAAAFDAAAERWLAETIRNAVRRTSVVDTAPTRRPAQAQTLVVVRRR